MLKNTLKKIILLPFYLLSLLGDFYSRFLFLVNSKLYIKWLDINNRNFEKKFLTISHNSSKDKSISLNFFTPNSRCLGRVRSFSSKEPETLAWIDKQQKDSVFYDIGSNIGLYSIYFVKVNSGKVYSFEPSIFNLEQLVKNINLNKLENSISIITNPLHNKVSISKLILNKLDKGASEAFYGEEINKSLLNQNYFNKNNISCSLLGYNLDFLIENNFIKPPNCIKIDVDGTEDAIIEGAQKTLNNQNLKSLLIEFNNMNNSELIYKIIHKSGFSIDEKNSSKLNKIFNRL